MGVLVENLGTCEGYAVVSVEYVYVDLVDSTEYLLGVLEVTEDGTGLGTGGKIMVTSLEDVYRSQCGAVHL